jgi:single-strand DNA-binding protein
MNSAPNQRVDAKKLHQKSWRIPMSDLNVVCLVGRLPSRWLPSRWLARNAELGVAGNNTPFCAFSVATHVSRLTDGEWVETTHYFPFRLFGGKWQGIGERLHKGCLVSIQGRLEQDKWEQDGKKHSGIQIAVDRIRLLGKAEHTVTEQKAPDVTLPEAVELSESGWEGI